MFLWCYQKMRACFVIFVFTLCVFGVNSATVCESNLCECHNNTNGLYTGIYVNCSLNPTILDANLSLDNMETYVSLDLSRNNITVIQPIDLFNSTTLKELFLNENALTEIKPNSFLLPELRRLDLSDNNLTIIKPELFEGVPKLAYLSLANNKFTVISQFNFSGFVNLKEIILDNNDIGTNNEQDIVFDVNVLSLPLTIESISMSGVGLCGLVPDFLNFTKSLKNLTLSNNNLTEITVLPDALRYLDLSNNPIRNISSFIFENLIHLKVLKLNNLLIEEIPKHALMMLQPEVLEFEGNKKLSNFSYLAFGSQILRDTYDFNVENLSLKGCNLSTLDERLSGVLERVKRLDLQENPWACDCHTVWLRELPISPDLIQNLRCATPAHLEGTRIFDLEPKDFVCIKNQSRWTASEISVTIGIILYSMLVLITLMWVYIFIYLPRAAVNKQEYSRVR